MHPYDVILIISTATAVGWTAAIYVQKSPLLVMAYVGLTVVAAFAAVLITEALMDAQSKFPMIISALTGSILTVIAIRIVGRRWGLR